MFKHRAKHFSRKGLLFHSTDISKTIFSILLFRPILVDFLQPESEKDKGENPLVDSLTMVSDWTVASKCALHGLIYVWDLKATVKNLNFENATEGEENKVVEQDVSMLGTLKFAETDNYYMNLGSYKGKI